MPCEIERRAAGDRVVLAVSGRLDAAGAAPLLRNLSKEIRRCKAIALDLARVDEIDTAGTATLAECWAVAAQRNVRLTVTGATEGVRAALAKVSAPTRTLPAARPSLYERLGERGFAVWDGGVAFAHLLADTAYWTAIAPLRRRLPPPGATSEQAILIGVDAVPIVCLISFLLGLIMAFQAAHQLRQFGANIFVANLVGVAMVREFGPLITAIIVAGRSGSAIAAELGTMVVGEEIDALRTMGVDPIRFLVAPRFYAISMTQPALTLFAMAVGVFGGFLIAVLYLDLSAVAYLKQTVQALTLGDLIQGLSKSLVFSWVIVLTGCHCGMRIEGGAVGVGRATTLSVVASIFSIIIVDSVFTTLSTLLG